MTMQSTKARLLVLAALFVATVAGAREKAPEPDLSGLWYQPDGRESMKLLHVAPFLIFSLRREDILGSFPVFLYTWPEVALFARRGRSG